MVRAALDSVSNQTFEDLEIRLAYHPENWPTKLNDAVARTRGEWVGILCDDDLLHPEYVATCMGVSRDADVIYTDRRVFRTEAPEEGFHFRMHGPELSGPDAYKIRMEPGAFLFGQSYPMTCLIRRSIWDALGGHDPMMPHSDTELWYRLADWGARFVYVPRPLFYYREHTDQMCRKIDTMPWALRQFHRKHFPAFGVAFHPAKGYEIPGTLIPIERRLGYRAAYLTSLTTTGYMATDKRTIPETAKIAIRQTQKNAEDRVNGVITLALVELGLRPQDGWKIDGDYNAVREVPDAPADLTVPIAVTETVAPPSGDFTAVPDAETGMRIVA